MRSHRAAVNSSLKTKCSLRAATFTNAAVNSLETKCSPRAAACDELTQSSSQQPAENRQCSLRKQQPVMRSHKRSQQQADKVLTQSSPRAHRAAVNTRLIQCFTRAAARDEPHCSSQQPVETVLNQAATCDEPTQSSSQQQVETKCSLRAAACRYPTSAAVNSRLETKCSLRQQPVMCAHRAAVNTRLKQCSPQSSTRCGPTSAAVNSRLKQVFISKQQPRRAPHRAITAG
jgi:hypothetical protein